VPGSDFDVGLGYGEPGGLGGNSLPKALNRKILSYLGEDPAVESFLKEE
jgi:hypothetical protein